MSWILLVYPFLSKFIIFGEFVTHNDIILNKLLRDIREIRDKISLLAHREFVDYMTIVSAM